VDDITRTIEDHHIYGLGTCCVRAFNKSSFVTNANHNPALIFLNASSSMNPLGKFVNMTAKFYPTSIIDLKGLFQDNWRSVCGEDTRYVAIFKIGMKVDRTSSP
jgi:hypothetical protein